MRTRQRGTYGWLGLGLVALACLRAQATVDPGDPPELRSRELQVELASSDNFYLELDPQARLLELKLAGVVLRSYPLQNVQVRVPRIAFVRVDRPRDWGLRIWNGPKLDPQRPLNRIEYNPTSRDTVTDTLATVVKLLLEGLKPIKVPPEYRIRFDGGFSLAVASPADSAAGSVVARMRTRLQDLADVLANRRLQVRVELARADAEHLYRALPPDTRLVVLAGARHVVEPTGKSKDLAGPAVRPPSAPATTVVPAGAHPESGGAHPGGAESTSTRPASAPGEDSAPPAPPDSGAAAPDSSAAPDSVGSGLPPGSLQ
ncbi:MAG TPA: hypothetical protein VE964_14975 [Myxococcales bacterium]|nr:hypothetical protein [Myxococcales bacterium]